MSWNLDSSRPIYAQIIEKYRWILYQANISQATNFLRSEI